MFIGVFVRLSHLFPLKNKWLSKQKNHRCTIRGPTSIVSIANQKGYLYLSSQLFITCSHPILQPRSFLLLRLSKGFPSFKSQVKNLLLNGHMPSRHLPPRTPQYSKQTSVQNSIMNSLRPISASYVFQMRDLCYHRRQEKLHVNYS